ncbi:MAG: 4-hydroxy-3-methylbut-2-enyl diphosphate reductase [bacterium]|nr:4-hydroxy-3-methylbut-2-enyl diphosphate reductase [bacterium]
MNVYIAEEAGFCFGVKRALTIINGLNEEKQETQIYGRLIHNRTVLHQLKSKGIDTIDNLDQLDPQKKLVIRTHGIPRQDEERLKKENIACTDATCPLVKKLHHIIETLDEEKTRIVIVGDKNHPEIIAVQSYAKNAAVINSEAEAQKIKKTKSISVIAQTTLNTDHFNKIVSLLKSRADKLEIHNTICDATRVRQQAIKKLAPKVDCVVVLGGKDSSNTRKLYNIALELNKNTFYVEQSSHLSEPGFTRKIKHFQSVGITAGASTPPLEIENAKNILENIKNNINNRCLVKETNNGKRKRNSNH